MINISRIQQKIEENVIGKVVPRHTKDGHFYYHPLLDKTYPSVNGKIGILKEEGLSDWKMNKALDFLFSNIRSINDNNAIEMRDKAEQASVIEFEDAGDIGTEVHDYREKIFKDWIAQGKRPDDFCSYIDQSEYDIRTVSCLRALSSFCDDYTYRPIATELLVFSDKLGLGGTLDDIGVVSINGKDYLCLMDLKTSNQLKETYWIQVALYYHMFVSLTKIRPTKQFILKLDKNNGTYKVEFIKNISSIVTMAKYVLKVYDGIKNIKKLREREFITI